MSRSWLTLGVTPPGQNATAMERLRFVRDMQIRALVIVIPAFVVGVLADPPAPFVIVAAVALGALILDAIRLTVRISRDDG